MADEAFENVEICTTLKLGSLVAGQYLDKLVSYEIPIPPKKIQCM